MVRVIDPGAGKAPIYVWARKIDGETERQLVRLASLPFVTGHVAAMADAHLAEGVAVGSVFATERAIVPAALGGDLGCGVAAVPFRLPEGGLGRRELERMWTALSDVVPVGSRVQAGHGLELPAPIAGAVMSTKRLEHDRDRLGARHLGTLGGGNHFLELDRDTSGRLWVMVHSGSRGFGAAIFAHHHKAGGEHGLFALDAESEEGRAYLLDLEVALAFARANRAEMLARAATVIGEELGGVPYEDERVDVQHNFVRREVHGGRTLWLHRKGATTASTGEVALIPGTMGTASYVVRGLGCAASYGSCSHGAGRVLSRSAARARVKKADLERQMKKVVFDREHLAALVEEAPAAYRDIADVLEDQAELVEPIWRLEPLAVLKG